MSTVAEKEILEAIEKLQEENRILTKELGQLNRNLTNFAALLMEFVEPELEEHSLGPRGPGEPEWMMYN